MLLKGLSFQNVLPIKTENIIKVASLLLHTSITPAYVYATTVACPHICTLVSYRWRTLTSITVRYKFYYYWNSFQAQNYNASQNWNSPHRFSWNSATESIDFLCFHVCRLDDSFNARSVVTGACNIHSPSRRPLPHVEKVHAPLAVMIEKTRRF